MTIEILNLADVIGILKVSQPTLYRWLAESRRGAGRFPLPISGTKRKLLWNKIDIEAFCQSPAAPPVNVPSPSKQAKAAAKQRAETIAALKRHGMKTADELPVNRSGLEQ